MIKRQSRHSYIAARSAHILRELVRGHGLFSYIAQVGGMRSPDRESTELSRLHHAGKKSILFHSLIFFTQKIYQCSHRWQHTAARGEDRVNHFPLRLPCIEYHLQLTGSQLVADH